VSRLVSPVMNTAGSTSLDFEFQHYLNDYYGSAYAIGVRTTSDGGSTWNTAWEVSPTGDIGPELKVLTVSTPDVGSQNFQIAFVFDGYSWNLNYWYIDNIHLEGGQGTALGFIDGEVTLDGGTGNVEDVIITADDYVTSPNTSGYYIIPLPAGTYDVIASLDGYEIVTENNVQVTPTQTVTINFELTYLQAPENLVASVISNDVTLEWDITTLRTIGTREKKSNISKVSLENRVEFDESNFVQTSSRSLTGFKIYRNSVEITQIHQPSQTSYSDNGLDSGDYSYYVTAIYDDNNESLPSNTAEVTVVLDPPTNLTAELLEPNIILNWDAPSAERSLTGYRVYRNGLSIADVTETTYTDSDLPTGIYTYFVTGLYGGYESAATNEVIVELTEADNPLIPSHTALIGNYPNPFNPETVISFSILEGSANTEISIYNIKGQMVRTLLNTKLPSGFHTIIWDGKSDAGSLVTSGIYFYKMQNADYIRTRKMILLK
ncbi:MAG: T9SS type A sorting domain-containing protein, partial [Candidatus Delongbacteria bacterium]|nr:T9SS type A sorting domain-containing protein [Candidatus Delongbacteria bacterium]